MKKLLLSLCPLLLALSLSAQDAEKRPITAAEYDAAKKLTVKNLEKDSYVKAGSFILDRSGDPFVFKFSDGTERRVYLYKLFETEKMAELGLFVIYTTPKDGKLRAFPVPSPDAPGDVWGKYIDDLKYGEDAMKGMASCVAFALTKSGVGGTPVAAKEGEKIEYCFPATVQVTLADGRQKVITEVRAGDRLRSIDPVTKDHSETVVLKPQVHRGQAFSLTRVRLIDPAAQVTASTQSGFDLRELEATANHPVLTSTGKKALGEVRVGEELFLMDAATQVLRAYRVFTVQPSYRRVEEVYNLITDRPTYVINGVVVFAK
jgi:hypothetical protein